MCPQRTLRETPASSSSPSHLKASPLPFCLVSAHPSSALGFLSSRISVPSLACPSWEPWMQLSGRCRLRFSSRCPGAFCDSPGCPPLPHALPVCSDPASDLWMPRIDLPFLAWKMEEGATNPEMWVTSRSWKR